MPIPLVPAQGSTLEDQERHLLVKAQDQGATLEGFQWGDHPTKMDGI